MRLNIRICVVIIFSGFLLLTRGVRGQSNQHLQKAIETSMATEKLMGAVWATVESNGRIHTGSAGIKNNDSKEPLMPTDRVHVGSIAKTVLAAGILHLATTGKLNIDDPVKKYLPEVKFINPWEATNQITLRHLLDHTSGLSDVRLWHVFSTTANPDGPLSDFFTKDPSVLQLQTRPGSIFSYSNMGYTLLGMVIESVSKSRYEAYLDESVLKPLGMYTSTFKFVSQRGVSADKSLAMGHFDKGETSAALPVYVRPAGQFTTTAMDMGRFLKFMMSDGKVNGRQFIKKSFLEEMGKPQTEASRNGLPGGYSLGTYARDRHGVRGIVHGGHILGFRAMLYMFPEEQKAFFISHNTDSETADYEESYQTLIKHLEVSSRLAEPTGPTAGEFIAWDGYYVPATSRVAMFAFLDYLQAFTKVTVTANGVTLKPFQKPAILLTNTGNRRFRAEGRISTSHVFYKSEANQRFISDGQKTSKKVNGFQLLLAAGSFLAGVIGLLYLLVSGVWQVFKFKRYVWKQPLIWCFSAISLVLISIVFLISQPFISSGDLTIGSFLLALGTALLPLFCAVSIYKYWKSGLVSVIFKADFFFLLLFFQLLIVLFFNNLVPLVLWK